MSDKDFSSCPHLRAVGAYNQSCKPQVVSYASVMARGQFYIILILDSVLQDYNNASVYKFKENALYYKFLAFAHIITLKC